MLKKSTAAWRQIIALGVLLQLEMTWLIARFPLQWAGLRTAIKVPWSKWQLLLGIGFYAIVAVVAGGRGLKTFSKVTRQQQPTPLLLHLSFVVALLWLIPSLWKDFPVDPALGYGYSTLIPWFLLLVVFLATWVACLVPIRLWYGLLIHNWRALLGGAAISGLTVWMGLWVRHASWEHMAGVTFGVALALLTRLGIPAEGSASNLVLRTPTFSCTITPTCSGLEGIALIGMATVAYLWIGRAHLRFPRALYLLPIGMVVIWLTNVVRITLLVIVGTYLSSYIAFRGFHSNFGWLMFALVSLGVISASEGLGWFSLRQGGAPERTDNPVAAYLVPILTLLAATLICQTFALEFDDTYPLRMALLVLPLWVYGDRYRQWSFSISWTAIGVGLLVFILWIVLEPPSMQDAGSPFTALPYGMAVGWIIVRLVGSSLLVPISEELAFKGFLLRRLISPQFESVPLTMFTVASFVGSTVAFAIMHQRWLAAFIAGSMYTLLLYRRGNLWDAVQAHGVTNFCLGIYAIWFGQWALWN